jgi:hypothetical protein
MNINSLSSLFPPILQPAAAGVSTATTGAGNSATASTVAQPDSSTVSPAASFLNELQQLEQQNPTQFQQVLSQITGQLDQAATAATNSGNTSQATQLTNLAAAFQNAEIGGTLPTAQQLQQAGLTGHHHHHHHGGGGQSGLSTLLQSSNTNDSQTLAASIFGSTTPNGSGSGIFTPATTQPGL